MKYASDNERISYIQWKKFLKNHGNCVVLKLIKAFLIKNDEQKCGKIRHN